MTCKNCDCLDCSRQRGIDAAMNRANEMDDELWAPIHHEVPAANEGQRKTWLAYADRMFAHYKVFGAIPMPTLVSMVCQECGVRPENYPVVSEQVRQVIMAATDQFDIRKGKNGGVFRKASFVENHAQTGARVSESVAVPYYSEKPLNVADIVLATKPVANCTCKDCGNTDLNSSEKSCWKCGAAQ